MSFLFSSVRPYGGGGEGEREEESKPGGFTCDFLKGASEEMGGGVG